MTSKTFFSQRHFIATCLVIGLSWTGSLARAQSIYTTPYYFTTLAGSTASGTVDGTGSGARFNAPQGVAVDAAGTVYVADTGGHTVRKITYFGVVTTFAGQAGVAGLADGTGGAATFNAPRDVAVDSAGNVYVADTGNHTIRMITPAGVVTTLAGSAGVPGALDGIGAAARFSAPSSVAVDAGGNVYVADAGSHTVRKITPGGVVTTLAGLASTPGSVDGTGSAARFNAPRGVAVDASGTVYVADRDNNAIRKITSIGVVSTLAGSLGATTGSADGVGSAARFNQPTDVAVDGAGNVYVADAGNRVIRKISPTGEVSTLGGLAGVAGATDGAGNAARFGDPQGIAVDGRGNLVVADTSNHLVRMSVFPAEFTAQPVAQVVTAGNNATFTANVTSNVPVTYQWQKDGVAIPGATNTTLVVSNVQSANLGSYSLVATNMAGASTSTPVALSFFPPPSFTTQPAGQAVNPGGNVTLSATVSSSTPVTYQWQKDGVAIPGATSASLSLTNVQTANLGSYTLVATNSAGSTTSSAAVLSFPLPPVFSAQPMGQGVAQGATATFTANVSSSLPVTYQWYKDGVLLSGATANTLTVANVQPANLGSYAVVATNAVGSTTSSLAELSFSFSNAGRLINLSILTALNSVGDAFTLGYVVGGAGTSGTKPLVIRVAGPSLAQLGVPGTLEDPQLEMFAGTTKTGENDNWGGSSALANSMSAVGAFPYSGTLSRDAAAAVNVNAGDNSVRVSAVGAGTGAVIAEIYDATPTAGYTTSTPRLVNVSVLKNLGTGLTAGFVIGGSTAKNILIRAVGPTIGTAPFNVPNVVADPQLTLYSGQTVMGTNDNWGGTASLTLAFNQVGAFALPAASRDAALLVTLVPGSYTVQVSGVGGTSGAALVEVYEVP